MSFQAMMAANKLANQKAQFAAAEKERIRVQQEKEDAIAQAKKEALEKKVIEERRKEKEERERKRLEDEERKKNELPKTKNLYSLKQERIKKGLDPDGKDDHRVGHAHRASPKVKANPKESTLAPRDEKAKRAREALFREKYDDASSGGMALARALASKAGSDSPRPSSSNNNYTNTTKLSSSSTSLKAKPKAKSNRSSTPSTSRSSLSARDRLASTFDPLSLTKLNTAKRDVRTIEEIERDMKLKKAGQKPADNAKAASTSGAVRPPPHAATRPPQQPSRPSGLLKSPAPPTKSPTKRPVDDIKTRPGQQKRPPATGSTSPRKPDKRRKDSYTTEEEDSEDYESESDSENERRSRKRRKDRDSRLNDATRSEIWALMGRNRQADMSRMAHSDDESDDMEATGEDLWREERRAERLGMLEDQEEQARLQAKADEKRRRKLALKGKS